MSHSKILGEQKPPLVIDGEGMLEVPGEDGTYLAFIHDGARMTAWPLPGESGGILLARGGMTDDPAYEPDMLALKLSTEGLLYLSSDINALVCELLGRPKAPQPERPPLPGDVVNALIAASHALRSYQHGNSATDLAASVAELLDQTLARFGHDRASATTDMGRII